MNGELVGLARIIGDGATICYLQDVLVNPSAQRTGLGRALVREAVIVTAVATSTGAGWYVLLGTWVLLGIGTSLVNTPSSRLLADASTTANRNLVYTAQFALSHACFLVTYPIAGWLGAANLTGAAIALLILAAVVGAIAVAFARSRLLRADTDMPTVTSQLGR